MKAMYYDAFGKTPDIRVLPDPTPSADGVVIKVGDRALPQRLARLDGA